MFLNDDDGTVLVNRYALAGDGGLWCIYKSTLCKSVKNAMVHDGEMVFFTDTDMFFFSQEGLSRDAPVTASGDATAIGAVWESGFQAFGADFQRKYSSEIYVSMLPQNKSRMTITAATDRRSEYMEKEVRNELFSWSNWDFADFTFDLNDTPQINRIRLKVKKFVYYKLIFKVNTDGALATVLGYDQKVRFASMAK